MKPVDGHWVTIDGRHVFIKHDGGHDGTHDPTKETGSKTADAAVDYRGQHTAPSAEVGSPLSDVTTNAYPKDFYGPQGLRYYAPGNEPSMDAASYRKIVATHGKPEEKVSVWRAIPAEKKPGYSLSSKNIHPGDWVTINRKYAVEHGEGTLGGKYAIAKAKIPAKELYTMGDSFHEWGWQPKRKR